MTPTEKDRLKAVRDRENMLMCAMDKHRAPGLPNLSSDEDSDEADCVDVYRSQTALDAY